MVSRESGRKNRFVQQDEYTEGFSRIVVLWNMLSSKKMLYISTHHLQHQSLPVVFWLMRHAI